jgi:hypothetical protein
MRSYAKLIWEQVVRYTFLDFLTAGFLCTVFYVLARAICTLSRIDAPYETYAVESIRSLSLIYVVSIVMTSAYWHFRLVRLFLKSKTDRDACSAIQDGEGGTTEGREADVKC